MTKAGRETAEKDFFHPVKDLIRYPEFPFWVKQEII